MSPKQPPHQFYTRLKIKQGQNYENCRSLRAMAKNTNELFEPYRRSALAGQKKLTGAGEERRYRRLSGPSQGYAAAEVDEDRRRDGGGGSSRARAEERWHEEEDGEEVAESPSGRPIYKAGS